MAITSLAFRRDLPLVALSNGRKRRIGQAGKRLASTCTDVYFESQLESGMRERYETDPEILLNHTYSFNDVVLRDGHLDEYNHAGTDVGCSVNLCDVVGVINPNYYNLKWGDVLRNKRFEHPFETLYHLRKTPEYYLSEEKKDGWYFAKINGKLYIDGGNHRTLIGRAFLEYNNLPPVIHGVTIDRYHGNLKVEDIFYIEEPEKKHFSSGWLIALSCLVVLIIYIWSSLA